MAFEQQLNFLVRNEPRDGPDCERWIETLGRKQLRRRERSGFQRSPGLAGRITEGCQIVNDPADPRHTYDRPPLVAAT